MRKRSLEEIIDTFDKGETAVIVERAPEVKIELSPSLRRNLEAYRPVRVPVGLVEIVKELIDLYNPESIRALIEKDAKAKRPKAA